MKKYNQNQIDFIRMIAPGKSVKEISHMFDLKFPEMEMTEGKMKCLLSNRKIKTGYKRERKYSNDQLEFLRQFVPGHPDKETVAEFNKRFSVKLTEGRLGNLKTKIKISNGLVGGQFQKGQVSWNKGKTWDEFMSKEGQANSLKTTFKKGNVPANRREISEERITKDGYIQVKVRDLHKNRNWELKHVWVWKQVNGEVPEGYAVSFLDGDKQNCDINNLVLVKRSENLIMNRENLFSTDREITKTGLLLAKVIDKRNKLRNENKEKKENNYENTKHTKKQN